MTRKTDLAGHPKKRAFLAAFAECGTITQAAKAAGMYRQRHFEWVKADPAYADAFAHAEEEAIDGMEQEARRRAVDGIETNHYDKDGKLLFTDHKYSDLLLIFLLKGARPDKYRERSVIEHGGRIEVSDPDSAYERIAGKLAGLLAPGLVSGGDSEAPAVNGQRNGGSTA